MRAACTLKENCTMKQSFDEAQDAKLGFVFTHTQHTPSRHNTPQAARVHVAINWLHVVCM